MFHKVKGNTNVTVSSSNYTFTLCYILQTLDLGNFAVTGKFQNTNIIHAGLYPNKLHVADT